MNFNTTTDEEGQTDEQQQRESARASQEPGEHVTRAEYVNFVRDLEEALTEFEERLVDLEGAAAASDDVRAELDRLEELHEDHMEMFELLHGDVQMRGMGKKFQYKRPEAAREEAESEEA